MNLSSQLFTFDIARLTGIVCILLPTPTTTPTTTRGSTQVLHRQCRGSLQLVQIFHWFKWLCFKIFQRRLLVLRIQLSRCYSWKHHQVKKITFVYSLMIIFLGDCTNMKFPYRVFLTTLILKPRSDYVSFINKKDITHVYLYPACIFLKKITRIYKQACTL